MMSWEQLFYSYLNCHCFIHLFHLKLHIFSSLSLKIGLKDKCVDNVLATFFALLSESLWFWFFSIRLSGFSDMNRWLCSSRCPCHLVRELKIVSNALPMLSCIFSWNQLRCPTPLSNQGKYTLKRDPCRWSTIEKRRRHLKAVPQNIEDIL